MLDRLVFVPSPTSSHSFSRRQAKKQKEQPLRQDQRGRAAIMGKEIVVRKMPVLKPSRAKRRVLQVDNAPKKIKYLQFGVLSPQEIVGISEYEATQRDLYQLAGNGSDRIAAPNGVLDRRLVRCCPLQPEVSARSLTLQLLRARPTRLVSARLAVRRWQTASVTTPTSASFFQSSILATSRWSLRCCRTSARDARESCFRKKSDGTFSSSSGDRTLRM